MSLQLIIRSRNIQAVRSCLGPCCERMEVFFIDEEMIGLAIPENVLKMVGESAIRDALGIFDTYDLYSGQWRHQAIGNC